VTGTLITAEGRVHGGLTALEDSGIGSGAILPHEVLTNGTNPEHVARDLSKVDGVHGAVAPDSSQWRRGGSAEVLAFPVNDDSTSTGRATLDRVRNTAHAAGPDVRVGGLPAENDDFINAVYGGFPLMIALIATIMLGDKPVPALARDTVFAVVMIVCNGLVGLCIFIGGLRYREQDFQVSGSNLYLSVLFVMATITLIMPNYTLTAPGPIYSAAQLGFVSVVTLVLYAVFLYTQTIRHRDYFISDSNGGAADGSLLSNRMLALSIALLLVSLLAVVLLAKKFSAVVDIAIASIGAPPAFAGVLVALLILLPEGVAAISAARNNDLQKSINLALGSSLATIGLTIPAVAVAAYALDKQLVLGLSTQDMVLLVLTFVISMLTFGTGRTNILFGLVHMVVFAVFLFMVFVP
jgi:Ca2+:H+ antiporter